MCRAKLKRRTGSPVVLVHSSQIGREHHLRFHKASDELRKRALYCNSQRPLLLTWLFSHVLWPSYIEAPRSLEEEAQHPWTLSPRADLRVTEWASEAEQLAAKVTAAASSSFCKARLGITRGPWFRGAKARHPNTAGSFRTSSSDRSASCSIWHFSHSPSFPGAVDGGVRARWEGVTDKTEPLCAQPFSPLPSPPSPIQVALGAFSSLPAARLKKSEHASFGGIPLWATHLG